MKAPRRLIWMHSLSSIDVDVTFPNGQTLSVRAPPLDVSFLLYVQEKGVMPPLPISFLQSYNVYCTSNFDMHQRRMLDRFCRFVNFRV